MTRKLRIGVISQFYDPEPGPAALPGALARGLAHRGHSVRVVTGFPNYPTGHLAAGYSIQRVLDEHMGGVHVRRVGMYPDHGTSAIARLANYASFGSSSVANGLSFLRGADVLWVNASPITMAWPVWVAGKMRLPVLSHIFDLWPESLNATGFGRHADNPPIQSLLHAWTNRIYRHSAAVAYISPSVGSVLESRGVPRSRLSYVPVWADENVLNPHGMSLRRELGIPQDAIVVAYAGSLGQAQGVDTLLEACRSVKDPRFQCLIAGSGTEEEAVRRKVASLSNAHFIGRIETSKMPDLMQTADASFISLADTPLGRVSLPSKTQAALASAKPIIAAAEGDTRRLVEDSDVGFVAQPGNALSIAHALDQFCGMTPHARSDMGDRGALLYKSEFALERGITQVERILYDIARKEGGPVGA